MPVQPPARPLCAITLGEVGPPWWDDRPVFIVAGGPSLRGRDLSGLRSRGWVLGVNRAADTVPCDASTSLDGLFIGRYKPRLEQWIAKGQQVYLCVDPDHRKPPVAGAVYLLRQRFEDAGAWSADPRKIVNGANSGYAALNIALLKRARTVYLLGFDMVPPAKPRLGRHWHDGYPWSKSYSSGTYERWVRYLDEAARQLPQGVEVLNANPASAVRGFPFTTYEALGL